ncbi:MAG: LysM peptidoglycan-binding domain-containing protein [Bacteroidota bacterium]|nr:LysM peptidoglycan-binding domain-containing protein [Bacteroidota bacterium]
MTKLLGCVFFTIITVNCLFAQNNLEIKGTAPGFFLEHKVSSKESLYSIGRLYNIQPKELASYNHLQLESGLNVGQDLKIPLHKNNFSQTRTSINGETLVPLYHIVGPKETLYRLGINYNKVSLASLKKWNHLQSDGLSEGSQMIVGYLKVDKKQSELLRVANPETEIVKEVHQERKPEVVTEKAPVVKEPEPVKAEKQEAAVSESKESNPIGTTVKAKGAIDFSGGYFKKLFDQQTEKKPPFYATGSVGIFKSTSGWQDGKYYCFNNDASPGVIVKVTNNATGKIVYAKVLDAIPDIKQNAGLSLVLSNAAAEELEAGDNKFDCVMSYVK